MNNRFKYNLRIFRKAFLPWALSSPRHLWLTLNLFGKVWKKYKLNLHLQNQFDYPIPHSFVLSLTSECNLTCDHCYARVYSETKVLPKKVLEGILEQASSLGCFFFVLTGGDPMLYPDLLDILSNHSDSLFILITNGTLVSDDVVKKLSRSPNIIPVISLEGGLEHTDKRRGTGTYNSIMNAFDNLKSNKILYGFSITVTSENVEQLQKEEVFEEKYPFGARLGCFIEYIPTGRSPDPEGYIESCALLPSSRYNVIEKPLDMCLKNLYRDNQQCAHLYESLEHHPCMSHRQDLCCNVSD